MSCKIPLRMALLVFAALAVSPIAPAQSYEVLHTFTGLNGDGSGTRGTLVQVGNDFYGTTTSGGDTTRLCNVGCGTVIKIDSVGNVSAVSASACTPFFGDVLCPSLFADWIEELYNEGITAGCSGS